MPSIHSNTHYRKNSYCSPDMMLYLRSVAEDNSDQLSLLKQNLMFALQQDVTPRQRDMLYLYYNENLTMEQVGKELGVSKSTVSRTLKRGQARLQRCLRYGAANIMRSLEEP